MANSAFTPPYRRKYLKFEINYWLITLLFRKDLDNTNTRLADFNFKHITSFIFMQ